MKPLIIVGPTASGKTDLSFWLASHLTPDLTLHGVDILVLDSKQVYRGQNIVTGKDIDSKFKKKTSYYIYKHTRLFGIDLVDPDDDWSVAQSILYAETVITDAKNQGRFLIIVGGTPQYLLSVFEQQLTFQVKPDLNLRNELEAQSVTELQEKLRKMDRTRLEKMNHSDRNNSRRLIRAIEVFQNTPQDSQNEPLLLISDCCWIGLSPTKETQELKIHARVLKRLDLGAIEEYSKLHERFPFWKREARAAIGYAEIQQYLEGVISKEELVRLWSLHEVQYAKRQMTWWKREQQIAWYPADSADLKDLVLSRIKDCYNKGK